MFTSVMVWKRGEKVSESLRGIDKKMNVETISSIKT